MTDDMQAIRATARKLAEQAKTDPAFKEHIQQDPVKTLTDAGLPENAVSDFLRETGMSDVSGYSAQICLLSGCLLSI